MGKNKWYMTFLIALILIVIFYVSNGMLNTGKKEEYASVTVILDNSGSDRWNAFKEGLEQGIADKNMHLNVVSTGEFLSLEEECGIISRELENGADGIIVDLCADDEDGVFNGMTASKPVVLVENGIQSENLYTTVAPDQYRLGQAIGEAVLEGEGDHLEGLTVGILAGNQKKLSQRQRLDGVSEVLTGAGVTVTWIFSQEEKENLEQYHKLNPVDVMITLENDETERAVDFLLEEEKYAFRVYGEGRSEKAVYYLDKGLIETLVVPNEFYMGYQSVELLAQKISFFTAAVESEEVNFLTVTEENLHDKDVEKILFPTVH